MTGDGRGVWAYAVTRQPATDVLDGLTGVDRELVRAVRHADLAAVVGTVGLHEFGEEALRRNLEDLDWLTATARAHDDVVATAARRGATVPIRLATVYRDDESVHSMLAECRADLDGALHRVSGRTEWGVKAYVDRAARAAAQRMPRTQAGAGAAYLARRRAQLTANEEAGRREVATAEDVHRALAALAAAARMHPPQDPRLSGRRDRMLLNGAYLIDDDRAAEFADAVATQERAHRGVRLELTGPWPPYSFVS